MKKSLLTVFAAAFALHTNAQTYSYAPVTVSGFTADVIANGSGSATASTSTDVDLVGYNFVAQNYVSPTNQTPAAFLPNSGLINSVATSGLTFQLAPYTGNNSLRLTGTTNNGTLTLATPTAANQIYLLATSVYTSTLTVTVNFTDGTNQAFTNQTVDRWMVGTGTIAAQNIGRVSRTTNILENPANAPRLYQLALALSAANTSKLIQSIAINKTSTGTNEVLHIMGVSIRTIVPAVATDAGITAITAPNSGCALTSTETITVTVKNNGSSTLSNIPVSYKIGATGTPVNEVVAGPVLANAIVNYSFTQKANLSALGTYAIEAKAIMPGDVVPTNDTFTKSVTNSSTPATPSITNSGASSICSGNTVTLTAASTTTGVAYQWFNNGTAISGATNATYTANAAGSYTATAIIAGTCSSPVSTTITLTVNTPPPAPGVNLTGSTAICTGDSATLTAVSSVTGAAFTWFNNGNLIQGATTANLTVKAAGSYTAIATANGCASPASVARAITVKQLPVTPTITRNGNLLTSSSPAGNQWFKNGTAIPGGNVQSLNASSNGVYTVKVTANGCTSLSSNAVTITNTGINHDRNKLEVAVYPNPSTGLFNLNLPEGKTYELVVTDLTGKVIELKTVKTTAAQIDLSKTAKGVYMLKITSENNTATRKLIVE
ncbi:T9SS type A sorting domain-containing protein [Adhaeribacter sp. BT258]|uniref:T9SS type A sorting domain-containing protein n=1 Tax=Adhaeribacter terrigena TaxID=2793070 RepID=A0ABS1BXV5_9BACT|nr:T9SS type A sorting domain-containing protein [Adhaeribacter terrigena]MBK0401894.1 T9SS type A sorting domain-containing protein [Adhaeribacter terrigena]